MRMTTQNQIYTLGLRSQDLIARIAQARTIQTQMRKADHDIAMFLTTQLLHHLPSHRNRIPVHDTGAFVRLYQTLQSGRKPEYPDAYAFALQHYVWLHQPFERRTRHLIVGTNHRKIGQAKQPCHILQAEVKLVIAYRHGIVLHQVHHLHFQLALKHIIIRCTLRDVSTIEQQRTGVAFTSLLHKRNAPYYAPQARIAVCCLRTDGFDTAMRIAGLQNDKFFGLLGCKGLRQQRYHPQRDYPSYLFHLICSFLSSV